MTMLPGGDAKIVKVVLDGKTDVQLTQSLMDSIRVLYHFNIEKIIKIPREDKIKTIIAVEEMIYKIEQFNK